MGFTLSSYVYLGGSLNDVLNYPKNTIRCQEALDDFIWFDPSVKDTVNVPVRCKAEELLIFFQKAASPAADSLLHHCSAFFLGKLSHKLQFSTLDVFYCKNNTSSPPSCGMSCKRIWRLTEKVAKP